MVQIYRHFSMDLNTDFGMIFSFLLVSKDSVISLYLSRKFATTFGSESEIGTFDWNIFWVLFTCLWFSFRPEYCSTCFSYILVDSIPDCQGFSGLSWISKVSWIFPKIFRDFFSAFSAIFENWRDKFWLDSWFFRGQFCGIFGAGAMVSWVFLPGFLPIFWLDQKRFQAILKHWDP